MKTPNSLYDLMKMISNEGLESDSYIGYVLKYNGVSIGMHGIYNEDENYFVFRKKDSKAKYTTKELKKNFSNIVESLKKNEIYIIS